MRQEWDKDNVNYQLDFFYDTQGKPLAVIYRQNGDGLSYYYLTNQQGDVTKLYKPVPGSGSTKVNMVEIATYSYDPWGKATVTVNTGSQITNNDRTLASINPLRYRGYYQDVETGFYYLQSRYYDPVIGRFINADLPEYAALSAENILDTNLFAYCGNDPVNHKDEDGEFLESILVGAVIGVAAKYIGDVVSNIRSGEKGLNVFKPRSSLREYASAAVSGAIGGIPVGGVVGAAVLGAVGNCAGDAIQGNIKSVKDFAVSATTGALSGALGYKASNMIAARHTAKIKAMPRTQRKQYLQEQFYKVKHRNVNKTLQWFERNSSRQVGKRFFRYRAGVYSSAVSMAATQALVGISGRMIR